jgi:predicted ArsR family transcriptional regulator
MEPAVLKALADDTRYAVYCELAASTAALAAQDLAERLGVHANTIRLHLDRLREVGLVETEAIHRGTVGRPQHLYFLAPGAPGVDFDPPAYALLATLLAALAERTGAEAAEASVLAHAWGADAAKGTRSGSCLGVLGAELNRLGFEPSVGPGDGTSEGSWRVEFLRCPFRELAEAYPDLVCSLHRGLCEGVVDEIGGGVVTEFASLYDPEPCHVSVDVGYPDHD